MRDFAAAPVRRACPLPVLVALLCACVHPSAQPSSLGAGRAPSADASADEFTLLSWNTHKRDGPGFAAELREFGAGVEFVLLQEVTQAEPAWSWLDAARLWTLVVAFEFGRAELGTGVATGTAVWPARERALLSPTPEPLTRTPKSALLTWVALADAPGRELLLVNLHGVNFRRASALAEQLRALDEALAEHRGPLVVAGDFNTWTGKRRAVVREFAERHSLVSAFASLASEARPRLDDVYVRGLIVRDARVLASETSDHDGLRVELALP